MTVPLTCVYMYIGICFRLCLESIYTHVCYTRQSHGHEPKVGWGDDKFSEGTDKWAGGVFKIVKKGKCYLASNYSLK